MAEHELHGSSFSSASTVFCVESAGLQFLSDKGFNLPITCLKVVRTLPCWLRWAVLILGGSPLLCTPILLSLQPALTLTADLQFRCPKGRQLCPAGGPPANFLPDLANLLEKSQECLVDKLSTKFTSALTGAVSPTSSVHNRSLKVVADVC